MANLLGPRTSRNRSKLRSETRFLQETGFLIFSEEIATGMLLLVILYNSAHQPANHRSGHSREESYSISSSMHGRRFGNAFF